VTPEAEVLESHVPDPQAARAAQRRRRGLWLLAASLLLAGLGAVGAAGLVHLVLLRGLLDHPLLLGSAAVCLFGVALCHFTTRGWLRFLLGLAAACLTAGLALGGFLSAGSAAVTATAAAPGNSDVRAIVEVNDGVSDIDQVWTVSVRQDRGLLSREWEVGRTCYSSPSVRWEGSSRLVVEIGSSSTFIAVDPDTGQPEKGEGQIWAC
jgi:hypothetical protein